jgi:hypothetical protein
LTLLVLLADASMHARSADLQTTLSGQAWVDRVLPDIADSTVQGREIAELSSGPLTGGPEAVAQQLARVAAAATTTYDQVVSARPPAAMNAAAGLLDACLMARQAGASQMAAAVEDLLRGGAASSVLPQMSSAVSQLQVGDSAYQLFAQRMPRLGVRMPGSQWDLYGNGDEQLALVGFAQRLVAAEPRSPKHALAIDAVSTNPPALSMEGKVQVLSPATSLTVTVVVANVGQDGEPVAQVQATVAPALGSPSQVETTSLDLGPGQARAVDLAGFHLVPSRPTTLTVMAEGPGAEGDRVTKVLTVEIPGANFTGATTAPTSRPAKTTTTALGPTTT